VPDLFIGSSRERELGYLPIHHKYAESDAPEYVVSCTVASHLVEMYCTGTNGIEALEPLRERFTAQHYSLRKFYYECSNLKYLTGLINVPKLGAVRFVWP
jgi:hypothetical protein